MMFLPTQVMIVTKMNEEIWKKQIEDWMKMLQGNNVIPQNTDNPSN